MYIFVQRETIMKSSTCASNGTLSAVAAPTAGLLFFICFHEVSSNYVVALESPYRISYSLPVLSKFNKTGTASFSIRPRIRVSLMIKYYFRSVPENIAQVLGIVRACKARLIFLVQIGQKVVTVFIAKIC